MSTIKHVFTNSVYKNGCANSTDYWNDGVAAQYTSTDFGAISVQGNSLSLSVDYNNILHIGYFIKETDFGDNTETKIYHQNTKP